MKLDEQSFLIFMSEFMLQVVFVLRLHHIVNTFFGIYWFILVTEHYVYLWLNKHHLNSFLVAPIFYYRFCSQEFKMEL